MSGELTFEDFVKAFFTNCPDIAQRMNSFERAELKRLFREAINYGRRTNGDPNAS